MAAGDIDFEAESFDSENAESGYVAWNNQATTAIDLTVNLPAASTHPIFVLLSIEFLQDVNNVKYSLLNGAFNACSIVKVDAP